MSTSDINAFMTEVYEARQYVEDLERKQVGLSVTETVVRRENLPKARNLLAELEKQLQKLRGDVPSTSHVAAVGPSPAIARAGGRMKIQAEAYEHWIRLKASGANPTVNSICERMARWCADNGVTTHTGVSPRAGTIRNTILGGNSGWTPPTLTRDQAKAYVEQLAQVAQESAKPAP
jgi:polyhydroxyalkanoate synthesis regulator phasin